MTARTPNLNEQLDVLGYVVATVIEGRELESYQDLARRIHAEKQLAEATGGLFYTNIFDPSHGVTELMHLLYHPRMLEVVRTLVEHDEPVLDGAYALISHDASPYLQGWHRDVLQVPPDRINPRWFSRDWYHNGVQINLALLDDACFWVVPGSHNRPNTPAETKAFGGSPHQSPTDAQMPGGQPLELKAGEAVFYNNNLIHRGHNHRKAPRVALHTSYHTPAHPPTWHFYGKNLGKLTPDYVATLPAQLQAMWRAHKTVEAKYPNVGETYPPLG